MLAGIPHWTGILMGGAAKPLLWYRGSHLSGKHEKSLLVDPSYNIRDVTALELKEKVAHWL